MALISLLALGVHLTAVAAGPLAPGYREPPAPVRALLAAPQLALLSVDPARRFALLIEREPLPPLAALAAPTIELGGRRLDASSHVRYGGPRYDGLVLTDLRSLAQTRLELPMEADIGLPEWSPDGRRFAFAVYRAEGVELWVADAERAAARRLLGPVLNAVSGRACGWMPGGRGLLCRLVPGERSPPVSHGAAPRPRMMETASGGGERRCARGRRRCSTII